MIKSTSFTLSHYGLIKLSSVKHDACRQIPEIKLQVPPDGLRFSIYTLFQIDKQFSDVRLQMNAR